jgi:hypothetical protein
MLSEYQMTDRWEYLITSDDFLEQTTGEFLDSISHHFSEELWGQYEQYHSQKAGVIPIHSCKTKRSLHHDGRISEIQALQRTHMRVMMYRVAILSLADNTHQG